MREYEQGESLRKVHWASTARRGQLMVKELEDAPRDEVVVVLDCHRAASTGAAARESLDAAVRAAGSIAHSHVRRGRRAVLALNRLRPRDAPDLLARRRLAGGDGGAAAANADAITPVGAMVGREGGVASRALELAVVTTMLDPQLAHRLLQRAATHRGVSLVWVDAASSSGRADRSRPRARPAPGGRLRRRGAPPRRRPAPRVLGAPRLARGPDG